MIKCFWYCVHPLHLFRVRVLRADQTSTASDLSHIRTLPFSLSGKQENRNLKAFVSTQNKNLHAQHQLPWPNQDINHILYNVTPVM